MKEIEINKDNLELFLKNIRKSDLEELKYIFKDEYRETFISTVLKNKRDTYFLSYKNIPSCIGGFCKDSNGTQVWLLCAKKYDKKFLYKYLKEKFEVIKENNDFIYNYIFKSNFNSIKMLLKLGFKITNTNDKNLKLFYLKG